MGDPASFCGVCGGYEDHHDWACLHYQAMPLVPREASRPVLFACPFLPVNGHAHQFVVMPDPRHIMTDKPRCFCGKTMGRWQLGVDLESVLGADGLRGYASRFHQLPPVADFPVGACWQTDDATVFRVVLQTPGGFGREWGYAREVSYACP